MPTTTTPKKESAAPLTEEEQKKKDLKKFWAKFAIWIFFSVVAPIVFLVLRFGIFKAENTSLSVAGIAVICIIAFFVIDTIKYVRKGMKFSYAVQIIDGFCKVIMPLGIVFAIIWCIRNNVTVFLQALAVIIGCEMIGIFLNPLPMWSYKKLSEKEKEEFDNRSNSVIGKVFEEIDKRKNGD